MPTRCTRSFRLLFCLLAFCFALAGCSGVTGTYEARNPEGDGALRVELKSGGVAVVNLDFGMGDDSVMKSQGTYTVEGDKVTITIDGDPMTFTLVDGSLKGTMLGESMILTKK